MECESRETYWIKKFTDLGALWLYQGEPCVEKPHGLMTSGKHSNGFFNGSLVIRITSVCTEACTRLFESVRVEAETPFLNVESVWGSAMGGIPIAYEIAGQLYQGIPFGFTEKDGDSMVVKRFPVTKAEKILVVEDVITTGGTTRKTIIALESAGAEVLPYILALVNRSGMKELDGRKIIALIDRELPLWTPEECPYCAVGSQALRPKEHWDELVGKQGKEK